MGPPGSLAPFDLSNVFGAVPLRSFGHGTEARQAPRFLIRDNDGKFGSDFAAAADGAGIDVVTISPKSPNLNAVCERFLGGLRECLEHVLILGEDHLRRVLAEWVTHFNGGRPHQGIGQRIPSAEQRRSGDADASGTSSPSLYWVGSTTTTEGSVGGDEGLTRVDDRSSQHASLRLLVAVVYVSATTKHTESDVAGVPTRWYHYGCRDCDHVDWVEDIIFDAFPRTEPGGAPLLYCPECGGEFRWDELTPPKRTVGKPAPP